MPALFNMMSNFPYLEMAVVTVFSMIFSFVTSQWMNEDDEEQRWRERE